MSFFFYKYDRVAFFLLSFLLLSCGMRKKPYDFIAKNNTQLKINKLVIGGTGKNPQILELAPNGVSEEFTRKYPKNCICFDWPGTSISVTEYEDSTGIHELSAGIWVQIRSLSSERTNTININIDPATSTPTRVFDISVD
jgi:hypothetical protein